MKVKLYRSADQPCHWVAHSPSTGWVVFPARQNGWHARFLASGLDPVHLREVPLWLAFNTGPIEAHETRRAAA